MRYLFLILFIIIGSVLGIAGDKTELQWRSFDAGLAEAKATHKKILLDVYTDWCGWCGWCKKLDSDVYSNKKVATYLVQAYIPIKLNAESAKKLSYKDKAHSETELAQAFGVRSYPTIIFLDSNGEPINSLGGYVDADRFLPIVQYIGDDHYKNMTWDEYKSKNGLGKEKSN